MIFLIAIRFICALLSFHSAHAIVYELYGSDGDIKCANATIDDTCILHCDENTPSESQFDCGHAGDCYLYCEGSKCLQKGSLHGNYSHHLYAHTSTDLCFEFTDVFSAEYSYFTSDAVTQKAFKRMQIHGSTNTQSIFVNCTSTASESCKEIYVNAKHASVLEIVGNASAVMQSAVVHCPQNSNYSGPHVAPCIMDFSGGGEINDGEFHTLKGSPQDLVIYGELSGTVTIYCTAGSSQNDGNSFVGMGDCYITLSPTNQPTAIPTNHPTRSPTVKPTSNPSLHPSNTPSSFPTFPPTIDPTNVPTFDPSKMPTFTPTFIPTYVTDYPPFSPTFIPTNVPTMHPIISGFGATVSTITVSSNTVRSDDSDGSIKLIVIVLLLTVTGAMGLFICRKKLKLRLVKRERTRTQSSMHVDFNPPTSTHWSANKMRQPPQLGTGKSSNSLSSSLKNVAQKLEGFAHPHSQSHGINPDFGRNLRDTEDVVPGSISLHEVHQILSNDNAASTLSLTVPVSTRHIGEISIELDALSENSFESNTCAKGPPKHSKMRTNLALEGVKGKMVDGASRLNILDEDCEVDEYESKGKNDVHVCVVQDQIMEMMSDANSQIWRRPHPKQEQNTPNTRGSSNIALPDNHYVTPRKNAIPQVVLPMTSTMPGN